MPKHNMANGVRLRDVTKNVLNSTITIPSIPSSKKKKTKKLDKNIKKKPGLVTIT